MGNFVTMTASFKKWCYIVRPWSFPVSIGPALLSGALIHRAAGSDPVSAKLVVAVLAIVFIHMAGNLYNTYFDYRYGVDKPDTTCDDRGLVDQLAQPEEVLQTATATTAVGSILGVVALHGSASPLSIATLTFGSALSLLYTSIGLKYRALGDLVIFAAFGPAIMTFVSCALTPSEFQATALPIQEIVLYSVSFSALTVAVLHANNARDALQDAKAGIVTVAIILGRTLSFYYFLFLFALGYGATLLGSLWFKNWGAIALVCSPWTITLINDFHGSNLAEMPQRVAQHNLVFMSLVTLAVYIA